MAEGCTAEIVTRGGVDIVTLRDGDAVAQVAPALGNNCFSFVTDQPVLEPVAVEEFLAKPTSYGIPIMLPFPNRIRDGRFTFNGETYSIDPPRHGMVRDKAWTFVQMGSDDGAWVTSSLHATDYADRILRQFPFPFTAAVTYRLRDRTLEMTTVVENTGDRDMPFGFGIHPYFRRPDRGSVRVPAGARWELVESLATGHLLDVEGRYDLRDGADVATLDLDDVYTQLEPDADGTVRCVIDDADTGAKISVEFDGTVLPHCVVYTAPAPRRAVCVEPQTCPTDAFNLAARGVASDMIVLAPGERRSFTIGIRG
jgi:aldose 1-epimerase